MAGFTKKIKEGADLVRPRWSFGWIIPAVAAVTLLVAVIGIGYWIYTTASAPIKSAVSSAPVIGGMVSGNQVATVTGVGWLN